METPTQPNPFDTDTSGNLHKHTRSGLVHRWLLDRFHRTARDLLAPVQATTVLDVGCGEGFAVRYLFGDAPPQVIGIDLRPHALALAHQLNPQHQFAAGSIFQLPFADNHVDLILCMEVLEHLDDPAQGMVELCRVSRTWLLLSVPHEPFFRGANFLRGKNMAAWGNDPEHVNHWSSRGFLRFIRPYCQVVKWRQSFPWTLVLCSVRS
jgi:SAM-dependent methyltransferase